MKRGLFFLFVVSCWLPIAAQTFSGTVYDAVTQAPVPGAHVFFDGTSIATSTDTAGRFTLTTPRFINSHVIVSHIAYEIRVVENPYTAFPSVIHISPARQEIARITVTGKSFFSRKQLMRAFHRFFLGDTQGGRSCVIENEDAIRLHYDLENHTLEAWASEPLIVENKYLGYQILYNLQTFHVQFSEPKTLVAVTGTLSFFSGTYLYIDISAGEQSIRKRRDDTFRSSAAWFFKCLAENKLAQNNFQITHLAKATGGMRRIIPDTFFDVKLLEDRYMIRLLPLRPSSDLTSEPPGTLEKINVVYAQRMSTDIYFQTDTFSIDMSGRWDNTDKITFSGDMGEQRLGGHLPSDYVLSADE